MACFRVKTWSRDLPNMKICWPLGLEVCLHIAPESVQILGVCDFKVLDPKRFLVIEKSTVPSPRPHTYAIFSAPGASLKTVTGATKLSVLYTVPSLIEIGLVVWTLLSGDKRTDRIDMQDHAHWKWNVFNAIFTCLNFLLCALLQYYVTAY
jgi:hypothetical protein